MDSIGKISRRGFLGLASATAAGAALGAWVSADPAGALRRRAAATVTSGPPGPGPVRGGRYGGIVHVAWQTAPNSLDPALGYNIPAWTGLTTLLFTPLYQFDAHGDPAPALAADMPTLTNGGRTYTIPLRKGAKFSNGRPIVAGDYVYSWTRVLTPKVGSWASTYLQPIVGSTAVTSTKSSVLSGVKALDDYTLQMTLQEPTITFLSNSLAQPYMAAVPQEAVTSLGSRFGTQPVGSGAFVVSSFSTADETVSFVPNDHFFWRGLPYLSGVQFHWGVNAQLSLLQLEKDTIQIIGTGIGPALAAEVKAKPSLNKYTETIFENASAWVALNCASGALSDARVRIALNWATDRAALSKVTHGEWTASGYPLPNHLTSYHRTAKPFGYDPGRARSLLAEAGASNLRFKFLNSGGDPWAELAELLQQQWKDVGVTLDVDTVSTVAEETIVSKKPLAVGSYSTVYYMVSATALTLIVPNWTSTGASNTGGYSNAALDKLVVKARSQTTLAESNEYVAKIEEALVADPPAVFLFDVGYLAGRSPSLHNFQYNGYTGTYYDRLWL